MTTASEAYAALRGVLEAGAGLPPLRWQNDDYDSTGAVPLPDTPAPFLFTEFYADSAAMVGYGGGQFANVYRSPAWFDVYCFVPKGWGLAPVTDTAEAVAKLFRSYRDDNVSVTVVTVRPGGDGASLRPPGLPSEVSNYFWAATEIRLFFDTIG